VSLLRFIVFNTLSWITVIIWATVVLLVAPFGHQYPYAVARNWVRVIRKLLNWICGLRYRVEGKENLPGQPCVLFIKHSSALETFVQIGEFPRACWVLKKELLWVPFFGWALKAMQAIAIDRSAGSVAVKQVVDQGKERLRDGISVTVFPEGTRMPPGETKRYGISGTLLAQESGAPIVPIAHNAGYHWPRRTTGIKPGEVVFVIGKPVTVGDRDLREVNAEIQNWIENEVARIVSLS
jgi:1-acyl-sn-glycerol-3-phosphate acyltransferase